MENGLKSCGPGIMLAREKGPRKVLEIIVVQNVLNITEIAVIVDYELTGSFYVSLAGE